jgi:anaerobic ribonucleoside-triphosphate reductase activating protein
LQGCTLGCPGCFNPQTHSTRGGHWLSIDQLFSQISTLQSQVQGVTISGGEPLQQMRPLLKLLARLRNETDLSILLFSGYTWIEIESMPMGKHLLSLLDVLVAGRFVQDQPGKGGLLGSSNQQVFYLSQRYSAKDIERTPPAEVILTPDGEILLSGIQPLHLDELSD